MSDSNFPEKLPLTIMSEMSGMSKYREIDGTEKKQETKYELLPK